MKIFLTLLFLFVSFICLINILNNDNTEYVYQEYIDVEKKNAYQTFTVNVENIYVTTKNINKYIIGDMKVLALYPFFNSLYNNYFVTNWYYFSDFSFSQNIRNYEEFVVSNLKNHGFTNESDKIYLDGARIKKIMVNTSYLTISKLKILFSQISIS